MKSSVKNFGIWFLSIVCAFALPQALSSCAFYSGQPQHAPYRQPAPATAALSEANGEERAEGFNTETYDRIVENPFLSVAQNPLSTFSIDVDTASYSNTRRFINDGRLPPPGAVRIEELINYFTYDYPDPVKNEPFSVTAEVATCPWKTDHRLVHIGLQGKRIESRNTPPRNLVFLLDVSGSMSSPRKLPLLKSAFSLLTEQLRENDRVAIAVYAGASGLVLEPTSGDDKTAIMQALTRLQAGGSTNGGAGIRLAYNVARQSFRPGGINRVILATDGDFNVGTTSQDELIRLIEKERESGVFLTVLGFGSGNYKDSTMEKLADHGNGNYAYIDNITEARKVLVAEAGSTLVTIAKDVKIQVEFNPERVKAYRLIGYENRLLKNEDFNDDRIDAGEIGAGHTVTALYEVVPAGMEFENRDVDALKYQKRREITAAARSAELLSIKLRYKNPQGHESRLMRGVVEDKGVDYTKATDNFRFSAAVAAFGMLLRDSQHKGLCSFEMVGELARGAAGRDPHGWREGFLELVEKASDLKY